MRKSILTICCIGISLISLSQGLEKVFVETYYIADVEDEKHKYARGLKSGMVTYRIWVDMQEGYKLLSIYGAPGNPLLLQSSLPFFNDTLHGSIEAPKIKEYNLGANGLLLDSYIALSGANSSDLAVLKTDDTDGSVVRPGLESENTTIVDRGMLMSDHPDAGTALRDADGLMNGQVPALIKFGYDFTAFAEAENDGRIEFDNGAWAVLKGLKGPFPEKNYVLIAQVTTAGDLSFGFNLQLLSADGVTEYYVASSPEEAEFTHETLTYPLSKTETSTLQKL
jgi:hypothetical protein